MAGGDDVGRVIEVRGLTLAESVEVEREDMKATPAQQFGMSMLEPESFRRHAERMREDDCPAHGLIARSAKHRGETSAVSTLERHALPLGLRNLLRPSPAFLKASKEQLFADAMNEPHRFS